MENQKQDKAAVLNAAFDNCGVKYHDRAAALAEFKSDGRDISITEEGEALTRYDGETLKLSDALLRFGYDRRDLVDARTLPKSGAGTARPGTDHRGNYPTFREKSAFIAKHGLSAWEALPRAAVSTSEVQTLEDWRKLPTAERVRRLAADPNALLKLKPESTGQPRGTFIAHDKLAAIKRIQGRSAR